MVQFQSTLPRRERHKGLSPLNLFLHFNPRSREGSDQNSSQVFFYFRNFNPRSREGSDKIKSGCEKNLFDISIHAPAKGATIITIIVLIGYKISIHAPAKGATSNYFHFLYRFLFQSTLPRRERRVISVRINMTINFNPRSREGSDNSFKYHRQITHNFNPRSREGSDASVSLNFWLL